MRRHGSCSPTMLRWQWLHDRSALAAAAGVEGSAAGRHRGIGAADVRTYGRNRRWTAGRHAAARRQVTETEQRLRTHFDVVTESLRDDMWLVAEAVAVLSERNDPHT